MENTDESTIGIVNDRGPHPEDLQINFSGNNKRATLFISYKDCHLLPKVLETLLKEFDINCWVAESDLTPKS